MFYQWGEVIGMRLEEMLIREKQNHDKVDASLNDPEKQNELVQQDEEEDFLDEGNCHGICFNCYFEQSQLTPFIPVPKSSIA